MGWGTEFNTTVYISKQTWESVQELEESIREVEKHIAYDVAEIKSFACANPKDIVPDDWKEEPIRWINNQIDRLIENIFDNYNHKTKLNLLLSELETSKKDIKEYKV